MKEFTIYWLEGGTHRIKGKDFQDAWRLAGISRTSLYRIDSYEVDGKFTKVAGQATCRCDFNGRRGLGCSHDLKLIGF